MKTESINLVIDVNGATAEEVGRRLLSLGCVLYNAKNSEFTEDSDTLEWADPGFKPTLSMAHLEREFADDEGEFDSLHSSSPLDIEVFNLEAEVFKSGNKCFTRYPKGFLAWASRNETFNEYVDKEDREMVKALRELED
jgi:hypothetical protein